METRNEAKDTIFLTRGDMLRAIDIDFRQYAPQVDTWRKISPMVLGKNSRLVEDRSRKLWWLAKGRRGQIRPIKTENLGRLLIQELERSPPKLDDLAVVCRHIFQTTVRTGSSCDGRTMGLYVETGMEAFQCLNCGKCCRNLDYHDQLGEEDYLYWRQLGRSDLLKWVRPVPCGGRTKNYRIWVPPGSLSVAPVCPWLRPVNGCENKWECAIHDVKPEICRQYPGTRKHALMTGCPGFSV